MSSSEAVRARALVMIAGLVARPVLRARDLVVARRDPIVRRAYLSLWRAERSLPPYEPSFEAVRRTRGGGLSVASLVWGETPLATAVESLERAGVGPSSTVLDLGAGRGMVLLAARMLGARARGIEIDPRRADPARQILQDAGADLVVGDVREAPLDEATHVWLSWTCMDAALRRTIDEKLAALRSGTRVVALTWPPGPAFSVVARERALFPWGFVDVLLAERR